MTEWYDSIVTGIKNALEAVFIKKSNISDDLTTDDATKVLSAKQGKKLQDEKVAINQGTDNNDKFLKVSEGNVVCESVTIPDVSGKEDKSNKATALSSSSTDAQYASAKSVYDYAMRGHPIYVICSSYSSSNSTFSVASATYPKETLDYKIILFYNTTSTSIVSNKKIKINGTDYTVVFVNKNDGVGQSKFGIGCINNNQITQAYSLSTLTSIVYPSALSNLGTSANANLSQIISAINTKFSLTEYTANKSSSISTDTGSTSKYPTVKAVEDYAQSKEDNQSEIISINNQLHNGVSISNLKYDSKLLNFQLKNLNVNKLIEKYWDSTTGLYNFFNVMTGEPFPFCLIPRSMCYDNSTYVEDNSTYNANFTENWTNEINVAYEYYNDTAPFIMINAPYNISPPYGIGNDIGISPNNHRMTSQEYQGNINYNEFDDKCWLVIYDFENDTQFVFKPYDEDIIEVVVTYTDSTSETLTLFKQVSSQ